MDNVRELMTGNELNKYSAMDAQLVLRYLQGETLAEAELAKMFDVMEAAVKDSIHAHEKRKANQRSITKKKKRRKRHGNN